MTIALATRWFGAGTSLGAAAKGVRSLGLDQLAFDLPGPVSAGPRDDLRQVGVGAEAIVQQGGVGASVGDPRAFATGLRAQAALTASLRASWAVVEGGTVGAAGERELSRRDAALVASADEEASEAAQALREPLRAPSVECAARALHEALRSGAPLAVRNGGRADGLLGIEETEWLLDALPGLRLAFDPTRALRLHRLGLGPAPAEWAQLFASRTVLVFVHGLGADLEGGSHPEDGAPAWSVLRDMLPGRVARILEVVPSLTHDDVLDAVRYVRHETFATSQA